MQMYNTIEGGPCVLRPTGSSVGDNPAAGQITSKSLCFSKFDSNGDVTIDESCKKNGCHFDSNNIAISCKRDNADPEPIGPWQEDMSKKEKARRHRGWSNQFGFPWEIGLYWNLTVGGEKLSPFVKENGNNSELDKLYNL